MCVREIPHQQAVSVRDFRVEQRVITEYIYIYILTLACQNDPKPLTRILNENVELQAIIQLKLPKYSQVDHDNGIVPKYCP